MTVLVLVSLAAALSVVILLLRHAHELSNRLICQSNMKAMATTSKIYGDAYPGDAGATIEWLVKRGYLSREQAVCPSSGLRESNYVLVPLDPGATSAGTGVVMYEPKLNHSDEGSNFALANGHVSFVRGKAYDDLVAQLRSRSPD